RGPHLVLAYVGKNYAVLRQAAEEFIEKTDRRLRESARIKFPALRPTCDRAPIAPVRQLHPAQRIVTGGHALCQITHPRQLTRTNPVQLRCINSKVNTP